MTYDYMVALHVNQDGMVKGLLWHKIWRRRWGCRDCRDRKSEVWHENTPALCFDGYFARDVWIPGCVRLNVLPVNSELCVYVRKRTASS